jgi:hypothetical protein
MTTASLAGADATESTRFEIARPLHFAAEPPNGALSAYVNQQPQSLFDRGALCRSPARPHGFGHQIVVDVDIRSHGVPLYV